MSEMKSKKKSNLPDDYISTEDISGCWACCSAMGCGCLWKRATSDDTFTVYGLWLLAFAIPCLGIEDWGRDGTSNRFHKVGDSDVENEYDSARHASGGMRSGFHSCKLCC